MQEFKPKTFINDFRTSFLKQYDKNLSYSDLMAHVSGLIEHKMNETAYEYFKDLTASQLLELMPILRKAEIKELTDSINKSVAKGHITTAESLFMELCKIEKDEQRLKSITDSIEKKRAELYAAHDKGSTAAAMNTAPNALG